ncbi:4-hydroxythreonine-4-phosphate dehydrogenase PdxA [soil metagenome]
MLPTLAITMGDPAGIGPEVVCKALEALRRSGELNVAFRARVIGDGPLLRFTAGELGCDLVFDDFGVDASGADGFSASGVELIHTMIRVGDDEIRPESARDAKQRALATRGRASFLFLQRAIEMCKGIDGAAPTADAIVTAPINKAAWHAAGHDFPGHTEVLAAEFDSPKSGMLFLGPTLRVILATVHIPLKNVAAALKPWKILEKIELGAQACREQGIAAPRIAVAGLNPHAGEGGLLGDEDRELIAPALERARERGIHVRGPIPGDAVFAQAAKGEYDLVVAMYHDQGLIPVKLLDGAKAVNVTAGLAWQGRRITRTSPAHGTAEDIAGQTKADATSMIEAIRCAARLLKSAPAA